MKKYLLSLLVLTNAGMLSAADTVKTGGLVYLDKIVNNFKFEDKAGPAITPTGGATSAGKSGAGMTFGGTHIKVEYGYILLSENGRIIGGQASTIETPDQIIELSKTHGVIKPGKTQELNESGLKPVLNLRSDELTENPQLVIKVIAPKTKKRLGMPGGMGEPSAEPYDIDEYYLAIEKSPSRMPTGVSKDIVVVKTPMIKSIEVKDLNNMTREELLKKNWSVSLTFTNDAKNIPHVDVKVTPKK